MTILELLKDDAEFTVIKGIKTRLICSADGRFEVRQKSSYSGSYLIQHYKGNNEADAVTAFRVSEGLTTQ